jgi:nucleotide-binding universal stress UspA family protein
MSSKPIIPFSNAAAGEHEDDVASRSHVVCGTDFTDAGRGAADIAAELARSAGEPLALVHAINEPARDALPGEVRESLALFERKQLSDEVQRLTARGANVIPFLQTGAPDEVLTEATRAPKARLLVLSSGQRKARSALLGSVVERVAEMAPIPMLVVRQGAPLIAWLRERRPLRVFVAAELTTASEAAIRWAVDLRAFGPCEITIAHIETHPPTTFTGDAPITETLASTVARMRTTAQKYFREYLRKLLRGEKARIRVVSGWGYSDAHLIHLAQEEGSDLIVAGTHHRHGLERMFHHSVSRGLLHYAPMNVATIPSPTNKDGRDKTTA